MIWPGMGALAGEPFRYHCLNDAWPCMKPPSASEVAFADSTGLPSASSVSSTSPVTAPLESNPGWKSGCPPDTLLELKSRNVTGTTSTHEPFSIVQGGVVHWKPGSIWHIAEQPSPLA